MTDVSEFLPISTAKAARDVTDHIARADKLSLKETQWFVVHNDGSYQCEVGFQMRSGDKTFVAPIGKLNPSRSAFVNLSNFHAKIDSGKILMYYGSTNLKVFEWESDFSFSVYAAFSFNEASAVKLIDRGPPIS
ncbi:MULTISPECIES: hypothetical protein [unclassified Caulobacter]|uniref:hypothetical protein n=1 Tax=unclassified Caulobacter TaxID=2648921 RepID=UPI0011B297AF|nr:MULTISPECIES: hypothetical protein [unclassified Caulobacter]